MSEPDVACLLGGTVHPTFMCRLGSAIGLGFVCGVETARGPETGWRGGILNG